MKKNIKKSKLPPEVKKYLIAIFAVMLMLLLFKKMMIVIALMIICVVVSFFIGSISIRSLGIEMVLFTVVITGMIAGSLFAAIVGLILIIWHMFITKSMGTYLMWVIPSYCIAGIVAGFFPLSSVSQVGIALSIIINVVCVTFTAIFSTGQIVKYIPWSITNIIFNVMMFKYVAGAVVGVAG